jgi:hypothetical protein
MPWWWRLGVILWCGRCTLVFVLDRDGERESADDS